MTPIFGPALMEVLIASVAGGRMSIVKTRRRKSPEQFGRPLARPISCWPMVKISPLRAARLVSRNPVSIAGASVTAILTFMTLNA